MARRLGCRYKGTVIRGGVEAIRGTPAWMNRKLFKAFYELGKTFGQTGEFDKQIVRGLAEPERLTKFSFWFYKLVADRFIWDRLLKKNNAFGNRFAKPYAHRAGA